MSHKNRSNSKGCTPVTIIFLLIALLLCWILADAIVASARDPLATIHLYNDGQHAEIKITRGLTHMHLETKVHGLDIDDNQEDQLCLRDCNIEDPITHTKLFIHSGKVEVFPPEDWTYEVEY